MRIWCRHTSRSRLSWMWRCLLHILNKRRWRCPHIFSAVSLLCWESVGEFLFVWFHVKANKSNRNQIFIILFWITASGFIQVHFICGENKPDQPQLLFNSAADCDLWSQSNSLTWVRDVNWASGAPSPRGCIWRLQHDQVDQFSRTF